MHATKGAWVQPDGSTRAISIKGSALFDAFNETRESAQARCGQLTTAKADLAQAYALAVWAYRCVKLRADAVAGVPLRLLDAGGAPIERHPLLDLLRDVNPLAMNLGDLLRATESALCIWGASYWLKVTRPGSNRPHQLVWLNPTTITVKADPNKGLIAYEQRVGGQSRSFAPGEVIAFRSFNPLDDLGGLSPLSVALSEINAELNAARFVAAFFANDARPAGLLTTDQQLPDAEIARVSAWWTRLFKGAGNRWKTGIVGGGLRWTQIAFPPGELALPELRAEDRRAICAALGVPPGLAGAWESMTYATAREQKASFYEDSILPELAALAETLNWSLLPHYPDLALRRARLDWDRDSIAALRETVSEKAERALALYGGGLITREEARRTLGLQEAPGADERFIEGATGDGAKAIRDELDRWERFVLRRLKAAVPLRRFETAAVPDAMREQVEESLKGTVDPGEAAAIFAAAREGLAKEGQDGRCA